MVDISTAAFFKFFTWAMLNQCQINGGELLKFLDNIENIEIKNINSIIIKYKQNHKAIPDVRYPFLKGYRFDIDSPEMKSDIMYNPLKDALKEELKAP